MCHNLGANEALDPFTPAAGIHGAKYKWGTGQVALTQAADQSNSGAVSNWTTVGGTPPITEVDWNMISANPCPAGFRVPTKAEWDGVRTNNTWTKPGTWTDSPTNYTSGAKVGTALFLPAAGNRGNSDGTLSNRGSRGFYWSSTVNDTPSAYYLTFYSSGQITGSIANKSTSFPVRCIAE